MTNVIYTTFKTRQLNGNAINFTSDTIKVALLTSSYTPNQDTHAFFSDLTNEVTGTGYTAGGATLSGKSVAQDNTNHRAYLTASDTTWASSTITARYAVLYKSTGTASTSPLIGYIDFGADKSTSGDTFYIQWTAGASGGILYLS